MYNLQLVLIPQLTIISALSLIIQKAVCNYNQMLNNRGNKNNSQPANRDSLNLPSNHQAVKFSQLKDSFLSRLNKIHNKENNDPNTKEVKPSYQQVHPYQQQIKHSSSKNMMNNRNIPTKNINIVTNKFNTTIKHICESSSTSKLNKQSEQKYKTFSNDRSPVQKQQPHVNNFLDQYFQEKQQIQNSRKAKANPINNKIRQAPQAQQNILNSTQQITKVFPKQLLFSLQNQPNQIYDSANACESRAQKGLDITKIQACFNHPQKKASYKILVSKNRQKAFCQKCSVILVTKGYKVKQLDQSKSLLDLRPNQIQQKRLKVLQLLLFDIDKIQPVYQQAIKKLLDYKNFNDQQYKLEEHKLQAYYKEIFKNLQTSYQKNLLHLKVIYNSLVEELDSNHYCLYFNYQNIQVIKQDILPNINSIIEQKQIDQTTFQSIVRDHRQRLKSTNLKIKQIHQIKYSFYEYQKLNNVHLIQEINQLIRVKFIQHQTQNNSEPKSIARVVSDNQTELFRMSFGKETSPQQDRS